MIGNTKLQAMINLLFRCYISERINDSNTNSNSVSESAKGRLNFFLYFVWEYDVGSCLEQLCLFSMSRTKNQH